MSVPSNGYNNYSAAPPSKSNSSGCWKAAGIGCVLLLLLIIAGIIYLEHLIGMARHEMQDKGGFYYTAMKANEAIKDGVHIQKAIVSYQAKNNKYPDKLTDLVPEYLPSTALLHNELDSDNSTSHISWKYYKPAKGEAGTSPLIALPYEINSPLQDSQAPKKQEVVITLQGQLQTNSTPITAP